MQTRRLGVFWRFSLGEILVAIAIDAVLAATILDWVRFYGVQAPTPIVGYAVLALTYVIFPCILVPLYFATYAERARRFRAWHSPRNNLLMAFDVVVVVAALQVAHAKDSNRTRDVQLIALFMPIVYTMFLSYSLIVEHLKRRSRVLEPAQDDATAVCSDHPNTNPAEGVALGDAARSPADPGMQGQVER